MRPFNLGEARILEHDYCQAYVTKRLRNMGLMIALTVVVAVGSLVCKSMFAGEVEETKSRLAEAQGCCARARGEMLAVNTRVNERKWQSRLTDDSKRWLRILDSALGSIPADVWLDSMKNSDKESTLAITGRAASFDAVTALISALKCRNGFGEVRLESAKIEAYSGLSCVDFVLAVTLNDVSVGSPASDASSTGAPAGRQPAGETPSAPSGRVPIVQGAT